MVTGPLFASFEIHVYNLLYMPLDILNLLISILRVVLHKNVAILKQIPKQIHLIIIIFSFYYAVMLSTENICNIPPL